MAAPQVTLAALRQSVRDNLDEPDDSNDTGFWSNARLTRIINRAKDTVWMEARKLKRGYFEIYRNSNDGIVTILGESYDCANFAMNTGADRTLPPDFVEMVEIIVLTAGYRHVRFVYRPFTDPGFQAARAVTEEGTVNADVYAYTISGERDMIVSPRPAVALNMYIRYVRILPDLVADADTLEMPFPLYLAVEEVATWRAQLQDRDGTASTWSQVAAASVARYLGSHARQSTDIETVPDVF